MDLSEAQHFTEAEKEERRQSYPAHERDAREHGIPMLGSGRVFTADAEFIKEAAITRIPPEWVKLWAVDFQHAGKSPEGHPFAAVLQLWDRDADVIHIHHCIRMQGGLPIMHAAAMKPIAVNVPIAWPHDGTQRGAEGIDIATLYKQQGLNMLPTHATFETGGYSMEAGILEMDQRMLTGRYKVAAHLSDWFEEYRSYHREKGLIVKVRDDLMSASRVGVMAKRHSKVTDLGGKKIKRVVDQMASGLDFDYFA
jgi:hypothetical protein